MTEDLPLCSAAARDRGEPMAGSAPVALRWLLVEHPGPWSREPLATPPLDGAAGREVGAALAAAEARVLLIRRLGRRRSGPRSWYAVDPTARRQVSGTWESGEDLVTAAAGLVEALAAGGDVAEPMLLVCTHGVRDTCCAVRGRPIAGVLDALEPGAVWECTHLGGHRFAGTLLAFPEAACYGGLDADSAAEVVRGHRAGRVPAARLRGVTTQPPAVQAAVAWLLNRHGPAGVDDVVVGAVEGGGPVTRVELAGAGALPRRTLVEVTRRELPPAPLSCGKGPDAHAAYDVVPL